MTERVLVTGLRAPVGLDCARAFAAVGAEVVGAESVVPWAVRAARGRWPIRRLPPPRHAFAAFRAALRPLAERADRIVPTCEEVFYIAAAAAADGYLDRVYAPPLATLRRLHSKSAFAALADSLGLFAPATQLLTDPAGLTGLPLDRLVLKPDFSRFGTATLIRPRRAAIRPSPTVPWVAQEFVAGEEICLWAAVHQGEVMVSIPYRPRWRHGRSAAFAFEAIDCPAANAVAHRVAAATGMTGHLSFDLILTPAGAAVPIECNPRATSGLHLLAPAALAAAIRGERVAAPPSGTLRYLAPAMLLMGGPQALWRGRPGVLIADWRRGRDVIGRPGDRLPAWGALADAARFALLGLSRGRNSAGQSTDDIEWNGEAI